MKPPGRFLKQDPKTKLWSDIGEKKALDKTRQALREGAPELLKDIEGGGSGVVGDRGNNNNNNKANVVDQEIPLRMSTGSALTDSLFSANTIGGMNFGSVFNSFTSAGSILFSSSFFFFFCFSLSSAVLLFVVSTVVFI